MLTGSSSRTVTTSAAFCKKRRRVAEQYFNQIRAGSERVTVWSLVGGHRPSRVLRLVPTDRVADLGCRREVLIRSDRHTSAERASGCIDIPRAWSRGAPTWRNRNGQSPNLNHTKLGDIENVPRCPTNRSIRDLSQAAHHAPPILRPRSMRLFPHPCPGGQLAVLTSRNHTVEQAAANLRRSSGSYCQGERPSMVTLTPGRLPTVEVAVVSREPADLASETPPPPAAARGVALRGPWLAGEIYR